MWGYMGMGFPCPPNNSSSIRRWFKISGIWHYCCARGKTRWKTFLCTGDTRQAVWVGVKLTRSRQWHLHWFRWTSNSLFLCSFLYIVAESTYWSERTPDIFCGNRQLNLQLWPPKLELLVLGWLAKCFRSTENVQGSIILNVWLTSLSHPIKTYSDFRKSHWDQSDIFWSFLWKNDIYPRKGRNPVIRPAFGMWETQATVFIPDNICLFFTDMSPLMFGFWLQLLPLFLSEVWASWDVLK